MISTAARTAHGQTLAATSYYVPRAIGGQTFGVLRGDAVIIGRYELF